MLLAFILVYGGVFTFLAGGYLLGRLLIDRWHQTQRELQTVRLAACEKMFDSAKAQFRSVMHAMPEKLAKQSREVVDYWFKEEIDAEKLIESQKGEG